MDLINRYEITSPEHYTHIVKIIDGTRIYRTKLRTDDIDKECVCKLLIQKSNFRTFFTEYDVLRKTTDICVLERQDCKGYSHLVVDVDIEYKCKEYLFPDDVIETLLKRFNKILFNLINVDEISAVILTKRPYYKSNELWKHGLHIQYPELYMNKDRRKYVLSLFKEKCKYVDTMSASSPWLLFGSKKQKGTGTYIIKDVLISKRSTINEQPLKHEHVLTYLSRIFNTNVNDWMLPYYLQLNMSFILYFMSGEKNDRVYEFPLPSNAVKSYYHSKLNEYEYDDNVFIDTCKKWLEENKYDDVYEIGDITNDFLNINRVRKGECIFGEEHDRLGLYAFIKGEVIIIKCRSEKCKTKRITIQISI